MKFRGKGGGIAGLGGELTDEFVEGVALALMVIPKPSKETPGAALYPTEVNDRVAANAKSLRLDVPPSSDSSF